MPGDRVLAGGDRGRLEGIFREAVAAVEPRRLVRAAFRADASGVLLVPGREERPIPWSRLRDVVLVGGGKAGRAMAAEALAMLGGRVASGVIAVPRGDGGAEGPVRFIEAGHPLPDDGSLAAGREALSLLRKARRGDLVVALVSGGGSAMIAVPAAGLSLRDKAAASALLLAAGADIEAMNAVRKHLSRVKGGLLARAAAPARVLALLLSDVPGDDPAVIASGPFSPDPSTYAEALAVLARFGSLGEVPPAVRARLEAGALGAAPETPKPGDPLFGGVACAVVGSNRTAIDAGAAAARRSGGADVLVLPGFLRGEARACAAAFVARMRREADSRGSGRAVCLVAGGETTVRVRGRGAGGRSQEFALAGAIEISGSGGMSLLAAGTDGVDGPTDAAGAFADGATCRAAAARGIDPRACLGENDSHGFFRSVGGLVVTGPTGTNVGDLAIGFVRN